MLQELRCRSTAGRFLGLLRPGIVSQLAERRDLVGPVDHSGRRRHQVEQTDEVACLLRLLGSVEAATGDQLIASVHDEEIAAKLCCQPASAVYAGSLALTP